MIKLRDNCECHEMTEGILYAYYDLKIFPTGYDVFDFLYTAEIERIHLSLDSIEFRVVANSGLAGHDDQTNNSLIEDDEFALTHIVLSAGQLLQSCRKTTYYPSREEAKRAHDASSRTFPTGYNVDGFHYENLRSTPLLARYAGKRLGTFRATAAATQRVMQWIRGRCGDRKPIIITLDNPPEIADKNSGLAEWLRFAKLLNQDQYCVIFLHDTAGVFGPPIKELEGFVTFDPASVDIDLRLALYEQAYLNLFNDSGPARLCMLDDITRCIRFKTAEKSQTPSTSISSIREFIIPAMQPPNCTTLQKVVWNAATSDTILQEFESIVPLLDIGLRPGRLPLPPIVSTITQLINVQNYELSAALAEDELTRDLENVELEFLLAKSYQCVGKFEDAAVIYEKIAHLRAAFPIVALPLAQCLKELGKKQKLRELLERINKETQDSNLLLLSARIHVEIGEEEQAAVIYEALIQRIPNSVEFRKELALCYERHSLTAPRAIPHLLWTLEHFKGDPIFFTYTLAHSFAVQADYTAAISILKRVLSLKEEENSPYKFLVPFSLGFWSSLVGKFEDARGHLRTVARLIEDTFATHQDNPPDAMDLLALKGRVELLLGDRSAATQSLAKMWRAPVPHLNFSNAFYLPDTPARIDHLSRIVGGRTVFILCHGPSIGLMERYWEKFAGYDPCLFAVNRFPVFETGFLAQTHRKIDVWIATHNSVIKQLKNTIVEYLGRNDDNMLISLLPVLNSLGFDLPSAGELERNFDEKLLYFEGVDTLFPPSPNNPLRFISGNTLSVLLGFAILAKPQRIFIFGSDGATPTNKNEETHYGASREEFGLKVDALMRNSVTASIEADTAVFGHVAEIDLMATEAVFRISRPPIYNVSPDSAIDLFPRIGYDEALAMLEDDHAAGAAAAAG